MEWRVQSFNHTAYGGGFRWNLAAQAYDSSSKEFQEVFLQLLPCLDKEGDGASPIKVKQLLPGKRKQQGRALPEAACSQRVISSMIISAPVDKWDGKNAI